MGCIVFRCSGYENTLFEVIYYMQQRIIVYENRFWTEFEHKLIYTCKYKWSKF